MTPEDRAKLINRLVRSYEALPRWAKTATIHAMGVPRINPATGRDFRFFREMLETCHDHGLEILRDDFEGNGDLLPEAES